MSRIMPLMKRPGARGCAFALCLGLFLGVAAPARAAGPLNVTQLAPACPNADGTDSLDDTAAFTCAIALVPAGPTGLREIYIPAGNYRIETQLTVSGKSIAFRGEGQRVTNLRFMNLPAGHNGLELVSASATSHNTFAVRSLSVLRANGSGGVGIHATWPNNLIAGQPDFTNGGGVSITIEDVHIGTDAWTNGGPYWERGIWLHNARFAKIHTFNIHGYPEASVGIAGIQISNYSDTVGGRTVGVAIHDGSILGYIRGVHVVDRTSGLNAQNLKIRDAHWGFDLVGMDTGNSIANCHIRAYGRGITTYDGLGDLAIVNNTIYRHGESEVFIGIEMNRGSATLAPRYRVIGNTIVATGGGTSRFGITMVNNIRDVVVEGNTTHNMTYGIWLANGVVNRALVLGNVNRVAAGGTPVVDLGTSTYLMYNW